MPTVNVTGGPRQAERYWDRMAGRCVFLPVRYADDFVVLVSGTQEDALAEKTALADYLRRTKGLELSPEKTKVTVMTSGVPRIPLHHALGQALRLWPAH
ncbi:hypothetical protein [Mesorhizobium sp. ISC15]|uniref:hypothetical protein n=1 Tax=Mesorhizobium sp. ISC15 TaxID=3076429 RepID=UPI00301C65B4